MRVLHLLIAAVILVSPAVRSADAMTVTVAVEANWPPMEYVDDNGVVVGFSVDYVNAVAREAGFAVQYRSVSWDGIFDGLQANKYDMVASSVSITPEREAVMDFSMPYYDVRQALVTPVDSPIRRRHDFGGKRLGVQIGTTGHFAAEKLGQVEVVRFDAIGQALEALQEGTLDGVIADDPVATSFILKTGVGGPKMKIAFILPSDTPEFYGFAVNKGNTRLLDLLNRGIMKVQEKGIDGDLRRKWIGF